MRDAIPVGVPAEVAESAMATVGGAIEAARNLPATLGSPLIESARESFVQGLQLSALLSAVGSLALAIFAGVMFRGRPSSAAAVEPDGQTV
jgi:DHA2 family multidrug resistance protein-like MFS transporter